MRLPLTLSLYIGRQFLMAIAGAFAAMLGIIMLGDAVELIRRGADREGTGLSLGIMLEMLFFKTPYSGQRILPFAVLVGAMVALSRLTRSHELVVARAAGVSVWQFLTPAILLVFGTGIFFVTMYNPVASAMLIRFEQLEAKHITGKTSLLAVSSSGLWIRQVERSGTDVKEHMFHALKVSKHGLMLSDVIVFSFGDNNRFISRMDAPSATLEDKHWQLSDVTITRPGALPVHEDRVILDTELTVSQIQDSFASPMTLSFWQLPAFISTLEKAGFSALNHRMYWHSTLSSPFLLCAMVLIAAVFSLRLPRRGGVMLLIATGMGAGFMMHFLTNLISAFGQSGEIPVILAAWAPTMIALMIGSGLLLHLEDG
jgi:lipopolysaccharide export system permease protein